MARFSNKKYEASITTDRRTFKILTCIDPDPYPEEYLMDHKTGLYPGEKRAFKTWKHNRKTQWKRS